MNQQFNMKKLLIILLLFISFVSFGQKKGDSIFVNTFSPIYKEPILKESLWIGSVKYNKVLVLDQTNYNNFFKVRSGSIEGYIPEIFTRSLLSEYKEKPCSSELEIGMSKSCARKLWGSPTKINKSTGSWGIHEQWVYSRGNLYFENGILTSWQD